MTSPLHTPLALPSDRPPAPGSASAAYDGSRLALIVGHYKSGSSWLDNVLSAHPDVRGLQEAHVFRYALENPLHVAVERLFTVSSWAEGGWRNLPRQRAGRIAAAFRSLYRPTRRWHERPQTCLDLPLRAQWRLRRHLLASSSAEELCYRFFSFLDAELRPERYLLEKTPNNTQFVPLIRSLFPGAKLIAIYRDGRDVCVSARFFEATMGRERGFEANVRNWRKQIEFQLEYTRTHGLYTISYEALLAEGAAILVPLLAFLDLPRDTETVTEMLQKASFEFVTGRRAGEEDSSDFYRKGIAGDWKNYFTEDDKRIFKDIAGDLLITLGYERDNNW